MSVGDDGRHPAGCFYGGPEGEGYWFAVDTCDLEHDGDIEPLVAPARNVRAALDHLDQAGLRVTPGMPQG